ncbi:MAG: transcriptional regulator [Bacteroidetes bacterium GWA2_32_17]|nr:MAG: transcriptional regulator [Bacteroidetes bacterium GWA2_32_17]
MSNFGDLIKKERILKSLLLRQVAAVIDIDQSIISKFENGERKPTKEQVLKFAKYYKLDLKVLLIAWLSDKVIYELKDEKYVIEALKVAEKEIKYVQKRK